MRKHYSVLARFALLLGLVGCSGGAMAKLVLFSEIQGHVLVGGEPAAGAVIEQKFHWHWRDESFEFETTSAADGSFQFPVRLGKGFMASVMPHEAVINQSLNIRYEGTTYEVFVGGKRNYDNLGEFGVPLVMTCDLTSPAEQNAHFWGSCTIDGISNPSSAE